MALEVYKKLQEKLDGYSCGFPLTPSGVEFKILEKIFTEEEAEMFLNLNLNLESGAEIARRLGREVEAVEPLLEKMRAKGNLFSWHRGPEIKYGAVPFILGLYEFQLNKMDRELAELCEQYFEEALLTQMATVEPLMRAIPINRSLEVPHLVATYEDARAIIKDKRFISLARCICRVQQGLIDKGCGKPEEVCLSFGASAQHYIDQGLGRPISVEEALKVLDIAEEAGLVIQPSNSQNPGGLCCCCGDCCGILRALNRMPRPAEVVISNYWAVADPDLCSGCESCLDRCQMEAVVLIDDQTVRIDLDRCIGCGLCVTQCPTGALHLEVKPRELRYVPPPDAMAALRQVAQKRGRAIS